MADTLAPPDLPGFTYVKEIGRGGFARVHLYTQAMPMRQVAIKVLNDSKDGPAGDLFTGEANVMAQLSGHPSIVTIYAADVSSDGRPYIVMEYCPPPSLAGRFRAERMAVPEVLEIGVKIASAVETAHRAGILHRDIKPHNILTSAYGAPLLTDFGIAATAAGGYGSGEALSVPWSPPESFGDDPQPDPRSDVYSLAATVYSLLAGRSPFEIDGMPSDSATLMTRIERAALPSILRGDVPESLGAVLARAMSKDVGERHPTALSFARALQSVQAELHLHETKAEVLDASPEAVAVRDEDNRTQIRPISIVVPEQLAGTALRPIVVQPISNLTARRMPRLRDAAPVPDTMSRGTSIPADHTDGSHFLTPPVAPEQAEPDSDQRSRSPLALVVGGILALAVVGAVAASFLFGNKHAAQDAAPKKPTMASPEGRDEVIGSAPAQPIQVKGHPGSGFVEFTWLNPGGTPKDRYRVSKGATLDAADLSVVKADLATREIRISALGGSTVCISVVTVRGSQASVATSACGEAK